MNLKVLLLSSHYYFSNKKAGFHHLADAYLKNDFEVTFVTMPYSFLKIFGLDGKMKQPYFLKNIFSNICVNKLKSIINFSFSHPTTKKFWNDKIFGFYINKRILKEVIKADYIIFESGASLYFFEKIKKINSSAKLIYRVSDDLISMGVQKSLINQEKKILEKFDLVSVPNNVIFKRLKKISSQNIYLQYHGVDILAIDAEKKNPYSKGKVNAVFVGNSHFDFRFIEIASSLFEDIDFHIIGNFKQKIKKKTLFTTMSYHF